MLTAEINAQTLDSSIT